MSVTAIDGTGEIVPEPDWSLLLTDEIELAAAAEHWRRITIELKDRDLLAPANAHAIQRLVMAYVIYDRCAREVADHGAVLKPKRGNPKSIARLSPYFTAMRESGSDADRQEQELGIAPRRRSGVGKAAKKTPRTGGANRYLKAREYSRQMAASLRSIESQIGGFASLLVRNADDINASGGVTQGFKANAIGSILGNVPLIGGILKGLFGTKTKVVGSGLFGGAQSLDSVLNGGFDASYYSDIQKKKKLFGLTTSTKYSTSYTGADANLEDQFTLILRSFNDAILAAAGPLGTATSEIEQRLRGFVVNIGKIDLQGLTGDQIEEKLNAVFGAAADDMARAAFPAIQQFQQVGEGAFETLVRVASTLEAVTGSLDMLGTSAQQMSIAAKLGLADQFDSVSALTSAVDSYFQAFYTQEEQAAARNAQMAKVFDSLSLTMPGTLAGFRQLVEAQDLTTAAGQATYPLHRCAVDNGLGERRAGDAGVWPAGPICRRRFLGRSELQSIHPPDARRGADIRRRQHRRISGSRCPFLHADHRSARRWIAHLQPSSTADLLQQRGFEPDHHSP